LTVVLLDGQQPVTSVFRLGGGAATPARLILFDMLVDPVGAVLIDWSLRERRKTLAAFMKKAAVPKKLVLSPRTSDRDKAERWLTAAGNGATDGVVAKRLSDVYAPGERTMIKVKRLRTAGTADCVVGGFRYESKSRQVGSLLLILRQRGLGAETRGGAMERAMNALTGRGQKVAPATFASGGWGYADHEITGCDPGTQWAGCGATVKIPFATFPSRGSRPVRSCPTGRASSEEWSSG
jgi:ATP dependent DNA ligase domain